MSTTLIYGDESRLLPWAKERIGVSSFRKDAHAIGLERDGELVAVVVFDCFGEFDANMHVASDGTRRWLSRGFLTAAFAYPFIQLGLARVTGLVPESNSAALEFDLHIGFDFEGRHPKALPNGEALISLGLLKENCRWIPEEYRK